MQFLKSKVEKVDDFLKEIGCEQKPHIKGGSLYTHFVRISDALKRFGYSEEVCLAGRTHSLYSTESFTQIVLDIRDRKKLQSVIGELAESYVFHFCNLDRKSISLNREGNLSYKNRFSGEVINLSKETSEAVVAILVVNEIDHTTEHNFNYREVSMTNFLPFTSLLKADLRSDLEKYTRNIKVPSTFIRYIAHASIYFGCDGKKIITDPWLYPSTFDRPVLQGVDMAARTIDFLIPEPRVSMSELDADIILLSHLHTHHSPLVEIKELAEKHPIAIVCPRLSDDRLHKLQDYLGSSTYQNITFYFLDYGEDTSLEFGNVKIKCLSHTQKNHFAYLIQSHAFSALHIADALINRNLMLNTLDVMWDKFINLKPDYLFINAAPMSLRRILDTLEREIEENNTLTPIQAAKITEKIRPKNVTLIGMDNFSVWCNRVEYRLPTTEVLFQFNWALSFLAPMINHIKPNSGEYVLEGD